MKKVVSAVVVVSAIGFSSHSMAEGLALGVGVGLLGANVNVTKSLSEQFNVRGAINKYSYSASISESGIDYDASLKLSSLSALIDWHPFSGRFRVSGGLLSNNNGISMTAKPNGVTIDVGGTSYNVTNVGTLTAEVGFDSVATYVGVGFGDAVAKDKGLGFVFDLGVVLQGSPTVDFTATGALATNAAFQADVAAEKADAEDGMKDFTAFPVISTGVTYQF